MYDQSLLVAEDGEHAGEHEDHAHVTGHDEYAEEEFIDHLAHEGDEDAIFVPDFESAATEVVQADEELAAAFSTYMEARCKLSRSIELVVSGQSARENPKDQRVSRRVVSLGLSNRKSLHQRILESNCRICGQKGHWKSECPNRGQSMPGSSASTAPVTLSLGVESMDCQ